MAQKCTRPDVSPAAVDPRALRSKEETDRVVRLFEAFEGLVIAASSVHVSRVVDEEDDMVNTRSQIRSWDVTVINENGKTRVFQSKSLIEVIMKMVDGEQEKLCEGCWETKFLPAFSVDRSKPDGRCRNCRRCESIRVYRSQKQRKGRLVTKEKVCRQCGETKLLRYFSRDRSRPDCLCRNCKQCESIRVQNCQKRKNQPRTGTAAPEASALEPA